MRVDVLTLFPDMLDSALSYSVIGRARQRGGLDLRFTNIRDFADNKHKQVDDYPYGAGGGMVMQAQPIYDAYTHVCDDLKQKPKSIYLTPTGSLFNQRKAIELSKHDNLLLLCGHYEGVDQRVLDLIGFDEISIGDYVLTGGELAAMVVIDAVARMLDQVLDSECAKCESHYDGLLEYPQYTRPAEFMGMEVPHILRNGHHANICQWRREQALRKTALVRPDLIKNAELSKKDIDFLEKDGLYELD